MPLRAGATAQRHEFAFEDCRCRFRRHIDADDRMHDRLRSGGRNAGAYRPDRRVDLILMTEAVAYDLKPFGVAGSEETWNVATCNNARLCEDVHLGRRQSMAIAPHRIEIVRFGAAQAGLKQLRSDALDWSAAFDLVPEGDPTVAVRRGLLLAQVAEALFKAVEIVPVEVVRQHMHGGKRIVELAASDDEARMRLADALRVDNPHRLLRRLFEREEADFDAEWQLIETAGLGTTPRGGATSFRAGGPERQPASL